MEVIPKNSNVLSPNVVFKLKTNDDKSLRINARLVLHGKRDQIKDDIRKDSASADMLLTRLFLCNGVLLWFYL